MVEQPRSGIKEVNMAQMWQNVLLAAVNENGQFTAKHDRAISIAIEKTGSGAKISVLGGKS